MIFSFEAFKKYSPQSCGLLPPRRQGREDRRSRNHLHLRRARQSRTAADRRPAHRAAQSTGGKAPTRTARSATSARPRSSRRSAAAPIASRNSRPAATSSTSASRTIGAATLNVNIGSNNFDELHFEYFRDTTVALEAFKADTVDWRTENSAKNWATAYDFPAVSDKRVLLEEFPIRNVGMMQAFAFNIRRDKFQDPRVRLAFNYAFNFEEMNKQIFFGQYKRIASYFEGTELAATGLPTGKRARTSRNRARQGAARSLQEALYQSGQRHAGGGARQSARGGAAVQRSRLRSARPAIGQRQDRRAVHGRIPGRGSELRARLSVLQAFARPARHRRHRCAPSTRRNTRTGCAAGISTSSPTAWGESLSPGNEQRGYWGSQAADQPGSRQRHRHQKSGGRRA